MTFPTNKQEMFDQLVDKAHELEGGYLSATKYNQLKFMADMEGISYDDKFSQSNEPPQGFGEEYEQIDISDEEIANLI